MKRSINRITKRAVLAASLACAISITACSQDEAGADADTKDILTKFALGDTSVLKDGQQEEWYIPDFQNDEFTYEYTLLDLDGDVKEEMIIQMENQPEGFSSVFHVEDNKVVCWFSDSLEQTCFDYPLDNGSMVEEYNYGGSITYTIFKYDATGETEPITELFVREDNNGDESIKCPEYLIDGNEVSKEKFEQELKSQILDHQLDASAWTKIS